MGATTVRVSTKAHQQLKEIARADGVSLTEALNRIIEAQRRQRFLEGLTQDYVALREEEGRGEKNEKSATPSKARSWTVWSTIRTISAALRRRSWKQTQTKIPMNSRVARGEIWLIDFDAHSSDSVIGVFVHQTSHAG